MSLFGLGAAAWAIVAGTFLLAAVIRGYSGFGFALFGVIGLLLVLPPAEAVPIVLLMELVCGVTLFAGSWREVDWRAVGWLVPGAAVGTPLGAHLLAEVPAGAMQAAIALVVLTLVALLWRGRALVRRPGPAPTVGVGFASGLLNGSAGIAGPPVVLYFLASPLPPAVIRASLVGYFLVVDLWATAVFWGRGLVAGETLLRVALVVPIVVLGIWIGHRRFVDTRPETFRRFALVLLALLAVAALARALVS